MSLLDILYNPRHKVVFESSLYQLVEQIRGQKLVNFSTGEFLGEGLLCAMSEMVKFEGMASANRNISNNTVVFPQFFVGECFDRSGCQLLRTRE
jgi:hypothetical protein